MRRRLTIASCALVIGLSACGKPAELTASTMPSFPAIVTSAATPSPSASASVEPSRMAAVDAASAVLECTDAAGEWGGFADDFGPSGGGATADEALEAELAATQFAIPRAGYERREWAGPGVLYVYEVSGRVKVAIVISGRFGHMVDAPFAIQEMRACDAAEFGPDAELIVTTRVWSNADREIVTDIQGPEHCGWQTARLLHIDNADGSFRQYVRDPLGVMGPFGLLSDYASGVGLPADAEFSGYTSGELELWFVPDDHAAYVVTPDGTERWPRADPPTGCR